jgi:hypothetical protein
MLEKRGNSEMELIETDHGVAVVLPGSDRVQMLPNMETAQLVKTAALKDGHRLFVEV